VSATIAAQLEKEVVRVARGYYALAPRVEAAGRSSETPLDSEPDDTGLINAFETLLVCIGLAFRFYGHQLRAYSASSSLAATPSTSVASAASTCCMMAVMLYTSAGPPTKRLAFASGNTLPIV
jgi:hypothetical protein